MLRLTERLPRDLRQLLVRFARPGTRFLLNRLPEFAGLISAEDLGPEAIRALAEDAACEGNVSLLNWLEEEQKDDGDARWRWISTMLESGMTGGHLAVLEWALKRKCLWSDYCGQTAARHGHLQALRWARDHGCCLKDRTYYHAAEGGHKEIIIWLKNEGFLFKRNLAAEGAARGGHLSLLQWLQEEGAHVDRADLVVAAIRGGHLDVLTWLRSNDAPIRYDSPPSDEDKHLQMVQWLASQGLKKEPRVCEGAAKKGHLRVLKWAREHGFPWSSSLLDTASRKGREAVVRWAVENGCPWPPAAFLHLAANNSVELMKWAVARNCPWNPVACENIAARGDLELLKWATRLDPGWDPARCALKASEGGHVEILRWLLTEGWEPSEDRECAGAAAQNGHLKVLKFLRGAGMDMSDVPVWRHAAKGGHLQMMEWEHGFTFDEEICSELASAGNLQVLQWARDSGVPWNSSTTSAAAASGNLLVLQWAHAEGCRIDVPSIWTDALRSRRQEIWEWLLRREIPPDPEFCSRALSWGIFDGVRWALENGFPLGGMSVEAVTAGTPDPRIRQLLVSCVLARKNA